MRIVLPVIITAALALSIIAAFANGSAAKAARGDNGSSLVGNWTGESICVGPFPACHDEKVIYRIPKPPDEKGSNYHRRQGR
jgi:hypothetical protein